MKSTTLYRWLTVLLTVCSTLLIYTSSQRMSLTCDEGNHYYCGLEWLQEGEYDLWPENPVLSRVVTAIGPYLQGYRAHDYDLEEPPRHIWSHFNNAYNFGYLEDDRMQHQLFWMRIFVLPIFLLSVWLVWLWSKKLSDDFGALLATGVYAFTPVIMGHAGLATTDVTFVTSFLWLLWTFFKWVEKPSWINGLWLGLALGVNLLVKLSVFPYFGISLITILGVKALTSPKIISPNFRTWLLTWLKSGILAAGVMVICVWGIHGFEVGIVGEEPVVKTLIANEQISAKWQQISLPAPDWFAGFLLLIAHNDMGMTAYMFGELSPTGFWYFYPVALALKTPISAFFWCLLAILGIVKGRKAGLHGEVMALLLVACLIVLSGITSHINIGVRHIAVVYPLFAISTTTAALFYLRKLSPQWPQAHRIIPIALLSWQILIVGLSYPNFLNYFNLFAGPEPGEVMADSDLDWGQGLLALSEFCDKNQVDTLHFSYFGYVESCIYDLPHIKALMPEDRPKGWVAVSENNYWGIFSTYIRQAYREAQGKTCGMLSFSVEDIKEPHRYFRWLDEHELKAHLTHSIRVYYVE